MGKMKQVKTLITEMEATAHDCLRLVEELKQLLSTEKEDSKQTGPTKEIKLEEVRAVLASKAKEGYKDQVRALLQAYGAPSLSALDSKHYAAVLEEAGGIGHD